MFATVMHQVISKISLHPNSSNGVPAGTVIKIPADISARVSGSSQACGAVAAGVSKRGEQLPQTCRVLAGTFKIAAGYF